MLRGLSQYGEWQLGHTAGFDIRGTHLCPHLLHVSVDILGVIYCLHNHLL